MSSFFWSSVMSSNDGGVAGALAAGAGSSGAGVAEAAGAGGGTAGGSAEGDGANSGAGCEPPHAETTLAEAITNA
ncbi:MAG TPA: hypothetical protein VH062_15660 [Polyangiaceae bacterium]|nr:hypothetical protein [Polyangiaceae bacterium]